MKVQSQNVRGAILPTSLLARAVVAEFSRLSIEFLRQGPNEKFFRKAAGPCRLSASLCPTLILAMVACLLTPVPRAGKLKTTQEQVEEGMSALGFLMLEAARVGLSDDATMMEALTINELDLDDEAKRAIASNFLASARQLHQIIQEDVRI